MSKNPIEILQNWFEPPLSFEAARSIIADIEAAGLRIIDPEKPTEEMAREFRSRAKHYIFGIDGTASDSVKAINRFAPTWSDEPQPATTWTCAICEAVLPSDLMEDERKCLECGNERCGELA